MIELDESVEGLAEEYFDPARHDDLGDVIYDALRLWDELENPEEMI